MSTSHPAARRLYDYLDGRLRDSDAAGVRYHLETCTACSQEFARLKATHGALRELGLRLPAPPAQDPVAEARLMQVLATRGAPRRQVDWWWLPITAAATLLLALLVFPTLRGAGRSSAPPGGAVASADRGPTPGASRAAVVVAVRGTVEAGAADDALAPVRAGGEIAAETRVRTGEESEATLELPDGGTLVLAAGSLLVMPADPDGPYRLETGTVTAAVTPRGEDRPPFGIETPLARVEAIGTRFTVTHEAAATAVDVEEGKVRFVSLRTEEERLVAAGQGARADEAGQLSETDGPTQVALAVPPEGPDPVEPRLLPVEPGDIQGGGADAPAQPTRTDRPRGTIDQGRVRARVSRQRGALQACYADYVMRNVPGPVDARVKFVVEENGAVGTVEVTLSVEDAGLRECVTRIFQAIEFPRPQGGPARVFYPVSWSP